MPSRASSGSDVSARVIIAGTSSGAGKTTVACGLIGALRARELVVQGFKVGPDFIDPSHHALASGRPGRNLDPYMSGEDLIAPLFKHGSQGADISVIEGVMGLFDGASGRGELASTAHVSKLLDAPVILVVDAASMARSAAAIVHGFCSFDPQVNVAGVIFNKVGSDHHELLLRETIAPLSIPVLGALRRDERVVTPERHLGLVPAGEREVEAQSSLAALADAAIRYVDIDGVLALAQAPEPIDAQSWSPGAPGTVAGVGVAIARGPVFSFHYQENLEMLLAAGADLLPFDPLRDEALPAGAEALVLAGGFPEIFGEELAANSPLRSEIAEFAGSGAPVIAECGGLLYLCSELDGHEMCGVIRATAHMSKRLTLGYREATAVASPPWLEPDERVRGHEFHYSAVEPGDGGEQSAWELTARGATRREGFTRGAVQASFLHVHWAAHERFALRFLHAARKPMAVAI